MRRMAGQQQERGWEGPDDDEATTVAGSSGGPVLLQRGFGLVSTTAIKSKAQVRELAACCWLCPLLGQVLSVCLSLLPPL